MSNYLVVIEKGMHNYSAFSPDVLGCAVTGKTLQDTLHLFEEVMTLHLEAMIEDGEAIPEPRPLADHIAEYRHGTLRRRNAHHVSARRAYSLQGAPKSSTARISSR